jgi:hypothetical protein
MVFHFDHLFVQILYFKIYLRKKKKKLLDGLLIPMYPITDVRFSKEIGQGKCQS